jgi:hypothetical protein
MRFTTREVILAVTIIGLLMGWYLDRRVTIDMFDGLIRTHYNFKHIGGGVPYGRYVPMSYDRERFQLDGEREVEARLASTHVDVQLVNDRWVAEIPTMPGIMACGDGRDEAAQRAKMLAALVRLNGRRVYFPKQFTASTDELFPEVESPQKELPH